jgi:16S rRNA processing protein RimM
VAHDGPDPVAIVLMGRVSAAYGVRGMVRVEPLSEDRLALAGHRVWWLRPRAGGAWRRAEVLDVRAHGGALVAALAGVDDRDQALALRSSSVGIAREELPALADDELYWADLEGLSVVNRDGVVLGAVVEVIDNGAHAILRVRQSDGDAGAAVERLIPWVPAYVEAVDVAARRIDVDWPADF